MVSKGPFDSFPIQHNILSVDFHTLSSYPLLILKVSNIPPTIYLKLPSFMTSQPANPVYQFALAPG